MFSNNNWLINKITFWKSKILYNKEQLINKKTNLLTTNKMKLIKKQILTSPIFKVIICVVIINKTRTCFLLTPNKGNLIWFKTLTRIKFKHTSQWSKMTLSRIQLIWVSFQQETKLLCLINQMLKIVKH